ncbi:thiol-disulfide isomerase/thioredoxin [Chitinivorax tropicus]|uniref:Thiol-disulfide isomerase/thioredoxin n=1 Tax=Chitinivorax tropicus TaxID=714531 RepID=A0A840MJE5_9PROT|nr:TlpA disulfide reductase family protein [Chitinivorax tropicus]MBB5016802.1 thiol-disulfide isomerase/thioredoxin [Chitinivorax tropicus]
MSVSRWCVLPLLCLSPWAMAYQVGDTVDARWLSRLQVSNQQTVVVDFFAAWCESCRHEMPLLSRLYQRLGPQRMALVGVDVDDDPQLAKRFQADMKAKGALSFPVVDDPQQDIISAFKPIGMPALYIIKAGKVVKVLTGAMPNVDKVVEQALEAKP